MKRKQVDPHENAGLRMVSTTTTALGVMKWSMDEVTQALMNSVAFQFGQEEYPVFPRVSPPPPMDLFPGIRASTPSCSAFHHFTHHHTRYRIFVIARTPFPI